VFSPFQGGGGGAVGEWDVQKAIPSGFLECGKGARSGLVCFNCCVI